VPWINVSELPAYLNITNICLAPFQKNPQHESGVANKIYDYMLGKKPVIASDCKPQKKLIEECNCGIIYSSPGELKSAIIKLSYDPSLGKQMGENGYNAVLNYHNMGRIKERLISLYKEILPGE
jgi:glycosyltransferase involved in cell wall biosynthesis